ncbi:FkbM family methyltransferase [Tenacibaculum ovolyticum]|uniref:FkbM family methyltransferase n=1 Tax=Tenacibaculum ovolyticum TaxID=104270 RepID=UPI001EEEE722|nr:FkbM family methyltransferase [Tenacibaculum ovolyticum]
MNITLRNCTYKVDPGQNRFYWNAIQNGNWEPQTFDIFDAFIQTDDIVLDIGAWSGVLSLFLAKKAKKVHALDPDPVCYKELLANIELNPDLLNKISVYQTAISDKEEEVFLSARFQYGASSTSILPRKRDTKNSFKITTKKLHHFLEDENIPKVDFIKMDVEGAEFQILPNLKSTLEKINYPTFYVSFHYHFLNEHIYYQHVPSSFLNKVFLKLEKKIGFSLFKKKINKKIQYLFDDLLDYKYIYTADGDLVSKYFLQQHPEFIKNHDLVFTNKKWNKA